MGTGMVLFSLSWESGYTIKILFVGFLGSEALYE